jgi:hypothetical protein
MLGEKKSCRAIWLYYYNALFYIIYYIIISYYINLHYVAEIISKRLFIKKLQKQKSHC